ncbi:MAG: hypothetical protein JSS66_00355 [Armatimonadetes bacterium]|nr:hypothetical protein [Armatimonadota bacterium]
MKFAIVATLAMLTVGAHGAPQHKAKETLRELSLERTPCFGACPVYKVTIRSDGSVTYTGTRFVERIGTYKATMSSYHLQKLVKILDRAKFWSMKRRYEVHATDMPTYIVHVATNRRSKTVEEYGASGPESLWEIQTLIDGLLQSARGWVPVDAK